VLGLAKPVSWREGYFYFESLPDALNETAKQLIARAQAEFDELSAAEIPDDDEDARDRVARDVVARRGQSAFRAVLVSAYQGRCAITGCNALPVLEAAHLRPYRGPAWNVVTNGLLLRADIHSLLDQQLLAPEPDSRTIRSRGSSWELHTRNSQAGRLLTRWRHRNDRPSMSCRESGRTSNWRRQRSDGLLPDVNVAASDPEAATFISDHERIVGWRARARAGVARAGVPAWNAGLAV